MRNIGASIGIATVTTTVSRRSQMHIHNLGAHVTLGDPAAMAMLDSIKNGMIAGGMDAASAAQQAYAVMFGVVQRHAAMLSYVDVFRMLAAMFVVVLPLILIMRKTGSGGGPEAIGH